MSTFSTTQKDPKILLKHANFLKKLNEEIQKLQKEVNWIDGLNKENSYEVSLSVANEFVHDVNRSVYNLRQIMIKIDKNLSSYNDLKVFVNKLSKSSFDVLEGFGQEHSVLKSKLIMQMQNVVKELQSLFRIVENEELHDFETELVNYISEILSDIQKIQIFYYLKRIKPEELERVFHAGEQECLKVVAENHLRHQTTIDTTILEALARHTLNGVFTVQGVVFHFRKNATNYNDPIKAKINQVAKDLSFVCTDITVGMYEMNIGAAGTSPLEKCILGGFQAFKDIRALTNLVNHCAKSGKESENLKNLVFYGLSTLLCMARRFARDINIEVLEKM